MTDSDELDNYVRDELPQIIKLVDNSRVRKIELRAGSAELIIRRSQGTAADVGQGQNPGVVATPTLGAGPHTRTVAAPMVGVFYHAEQPGRAPLVQEGSHVERGSLIGVIEALQVLTEVESDTAGTIQRVVAADGQPVEYGQALVEVLVEV